MNSEQQLKVLDFERITYFYSNFIIGFVGLMASVIFMAIAVYYFYSAMAAFIWAAAVFLTYLPRVILSVNFSRKLKRHEITPENVRPWERYSLLASIAPFVCYAAVIFLPYGEHTQTALLICTVYVVLIIAGGSLTYATSIGVLMLFLNINLLSIIARCLWEDGFLLTVLAGPLIIAYFMLSRMIIKLNKAMRGNITMKLDSKHQSYIDPLTNLWNRRRLYLFLDMLIPAYNRSGVPFSIILMDVDHFKQYNDTHGHNEGDELLISISKALLKCAREQDLVVRYGGEEFMVVLPSTAKEQAVIVAKRILNEVRESTDITISAGVEEYSIDMDIDEMVQRADKALYEAKQAGRDTLKLASDVFSDPSFQT
jgi:diguanylate cyclase (GGDEF)-like protein